VAKSSNTDQIILKLKVLVQDGLLAGRRTIDHCLRVGDLLFERLDRSSGSLRARIR